MPPSSTSSASAPTATINAQSLISMRAAGRQYAFVDHAWRFLLTNRHPPLALETIATLIELGLGGPARELAGSSFTETDLDLATLRRSLSGVPIGRVPWTEQEDTFRRNLVRLRSGRPWVDVLERQLREATAECQLFRSSDGNLHLSHRLTGGPRRWNPGLIDWKAADARPFSADPAGAAPVFVGAGLSRLIDRFEHDTRPKLNTAHLPLFLVEEDLARFAAWLYADDRPWLDDERFLPFVGPDAFEQYEQTLCEQEDLAVPGLSLWSFDVGAGAARVASISNQITLQREQMIKGVEVRLGDLGQTRSRAEWADRLAPGGTILAITSRFTTMVQYSLRDMGAALRSLGYDFHLRIEASPSRHHSTLTTARAIAEIDPALIILVNHVRSEQPGSLGAGPLLTWLQDPTIDVLNPDRGRSMGPLDFVCGYYAERCVGEFGFPSEQVFSVPFYPISESTFHHRPTAVDPAETCDVLYVGHCPREPEEVRSEFKHHHDPRFHPLLDRLFALARERVDMASHFGYLEAERIVRSMADEMQISVEPTHVVSLGNYYLFRIFDVLYRKQVLHWVADWAVRTNRCFRLYGQGWSKDPVLSRFAMGPIEHGEPLRRVYGSATLTVQAAPHGFWHQRAFEATMCGSLVLTRYTPADFGGLSAAAYRRRLNGGGAPTGTHAAFPTLLETVFEDERTFGDLANRWLDATDERRRLVEGVRDLVSSNFTYRSVLPRVLERIRAVLGDASPPPWQWQAARTP